MSDKKPDLIQSSVPPSMPATIDEEIASLETAIPKLKELSTEFPDFVSTLKEAERALRQAKLIKKTLT